MSGRRAALRWLRTVLFLPCVVACSSSDGESGPVGAAGSAGLADPGGGGGSGGAAGGASVGVVREAPWPSWVNVRQSPMGSARVSAAFSLTEGETGCKPLATVGACTVYPGFCAFPSERVSAGTLTVASQIKSAAFEIGKNSVYEEELDTSLFPPGTPLTIAASGAAFPAFSLVTNTPTRAMILGPKLTPGELLGVPRHQDLEVMFDSDGDDVDFVVASDEQTKTKPAARCTFVGATGRGRVPAEVLLLLPPGNAHLRGETRVVTDSVQPPVRVDTKLIATKPGGTEYGGPVTLLLGVRPRPSRENAPAPRGSPCPYPPSAGAARPWRCSRMRRFWPGSFRVPPTRKSPRRPR